MAAADNEKTKGWIHCRIIIEVLGKPQEYVEEVTHKVVESLKKDEHLEVIKENFAELKPFEQLFSTFVEIELKAKDMNVLQSLVFSYMPSSIEILDPAELKMPMNDANLLFNDLSARLHEYDAQAKRLKITNIMLLGKMKEYEARHPEDFKKPEENIEEKKEEVKEEPEKENAKKSKKK